MKLAVVLALLGTAVVAVNTDPVLRKPRFTKTKVTELPRSAFKGVFKFQDGAVSKGPAVHGDDDAKVTDEVVERSGFRAVASDGSQAAHALDPEELRAILALAVAEASLVGGGAAGCTECTPPSEKLEWDNADGGKAAGRVRGALASVIQGADTRSEVVGATWRPTTQTGQLTFNGGWCSAALIGPRHVLTAGHCVHEGSGGDWYSNFRFYPSRTSASAAPFTSYGWRRAWTYTGWAADGNWDYDIALIELSAAPGLGWLSFGWSSGISTWWYMYHKGYPGDKAYGSMWSSSGSLSDVDTRTLWTDTTDTVGGQSGGPWYKYVSGNPVVYAAHSGAKTWWWFGTHTENRHTRITSAVFANLCDWIDDAAVC